MTLTTTAGSNGAWSLTLPTKQIEGQLINVTATDAAGNASGTLGITAPVLPLAARDNITSLDLTSTAVTSTQSYSDYGLLLVGALGNVASVLGNDTAQVEFTIAEGGTGDVTIDAAATESCFRCSVLRRLWYSATTPASAHGRRSSTPPLATSRICLP